MKNWPNSLVFALLFHGLILGWWLAAGWLLPDAALFLGLAVGAISVNRRAAKPQKFELKISTIGGLKWAAAALGLLALSIWLPARTVHFLAWSASLFFALGNVGFRITAVHGLLAVVVSSLAKNWALVFSFPLRLKMSEIAARGLQIASFDAKNEGNLLIFNGEPFAVDASCMGLAMLQTSLVAMLFCWFFFEKKTGRRLAFGWLPGLLGLTFGLVWTFNLIRIWTLVLGGWPPDTWAHELVGLAGWAIYVIAPLFFLTKWLFGSRFFALKSDVFWSVPFSRLSPWKGLARKKTRIFGAFRLARPFQGDSLGMGTGQIRLILMGLTRPVLLSFLIGLGLLWISLFQIHPPAPRIVPPPELAAFLNENGFSTTILQSQIAKFERPGGLIYAKPLRGFFEAEHSPLVCWQGDGWEIEAVEIRRIGWREAFFGILKKENTRLPTAWWYDNGPRRTASQVEWRANFGDERPFFLVNATAVDEKTLVELVEKLLNRE